MPRYRVWLGAILLPVPELLGEEVWAQACISLALPGVAVRQHDDGSEPRMFDLEVIHDGRISAAVEVTQAADAQSTELWKLVNSDGRRIESDLEGGWHLSLLPSARARRIKAELPTLLRELEAAGVQQVRAAWSLNPGPFDRVATCLGIADLFQGETAYPGSIYFTIAEPLEKSGGYAADTGNALPRWLEEWIRQPAQADNLEKLRRSGADERHLFVIFPGFSEAPFAVTDLLFRPDAPLPTIPPRLPDEVTHLWAVSTWASGLGMRWSPAIGWESFDKNPGIEDRPVSDR
jgi:hypothetical protein